MFKQFKSAQVFKLALPAALALESILDSVEGAKDAEVGTHEFSCASFIANPATGRHITPLERGYSFCIRYQEKVMPASAIKREVDNAVRDIEESELRSVGRKERQAIKEEVMASMITVAPVTEKLIFAFYDWQEKNLFVTSTAQKDGQIVCRMLCHVVGQVTSSTVHISDQKKGLAKRLHNHLTGQDDAFGPFEIGQHLRIQTIDGGQISFKGADFECGDDQYRLEQDLQQGAVVEEIQLYANTVSFVLDSKFRLKRITDEAEREGEDIEDHAEAWVADANVALVQASAVVADLCELFAYTPVVCEPKAAEGEADG